MAVITVKTIVENVLEEAGPLPAQDWIVLHRLKITVWSIRCEHLYLPLAFRIIAVAMRINLRGQIVDSSSLPGAMLRVLYIEEGWRSHRLL